MDNILGFLREPLVSSFVHRYYHGEQLQGEALNRKMKWPVSRLGWLIVLAAIIAWVVVEFVIKPQP